MRRNDKQTALDAFIARKAEIDTMLERLKALSDEHFGVQPRRHQLGLTSARSPTTPSCSGASPTPPSRRASTPHSRPRSSLAPHGHGRRGLGQ